METLRGLLSADLFAFNIYNIFVKPFLWKVKKKKQEINVSSIYDKV